MDPQPLSAFSAMVSLADGVTLTDLLPQLEPSGTWIRHGEGIIGLGVADRATAHGSERFAELAHWWEHRLEALTEAARPEPLRQVPGCGPVAFTSVTYSSDSAADSVLVLPELVLGSVAGRSWVTAVQPAVTADPASTRDRGPGVPPGPPPIREAAEATV